MDFKPKACEKILQLLNNVYAGAMDQLSLKQSGRCLPMSGLKGIEWLNGIVADWCGHSPQAAPSMNVLKK